MEWIKALGHLTEPKAIEIRKRRCRGMVVYALLVGVGAPEALVIGVVALLVFGPKGLADVARNLGKTLRTFQPTIRELQEVSREFKSTLEKEIGLNEISEHKLFSASKSCLIQSTSQNLDTANDAGPSLSSPETTSDMVFQAYSSEELLKIIEEQLSFATTAKQQTSSPKELYHSRLVLLNSLHLRSTTGFVTSASSHVLYPTVEI